MLRVRLETLIASNSHILNPNIIYPGDVLCVPGLIHYPCSIVLRPVVAVPFGTGGVAYVNFAPRGGQAVSFMATLPQPSVFGDFDIYLGEIYVLDIGGFGTQLFPTSENPPTWSARVELPTVVSIPPNSQVVIRPSNSLTGISSGVILQAIIHSGSCHL
ncbi:hypothetical protein SAMN05660297_02827 [Natronincola peptidivorans]|uniref:LysM domain-containing protein n=1 Tax=Natronincola peptidivorans TaxID=426128 RepID=A0A1I0FME8_9FIRM|nr:hypothetical protein [Natronincola peptidivorans]SET58455.1 hypothetical protein SAMN05660297_02827 [Natronincola peptidivorans]